MAMTAQSVCAHVREHRSILASVEKRALISIARRLPTWITSDHLSVLGFVAILATALSFATLRITPWAAVLVVVSLAANWFGDSLDGTVARVRGQQRPRYGFYVDHIIDLAGTAILMVGLACSGLMNPLAAMALLSTYLLVSAESFLATHAAGVFRMSFLGFGPTELRVLLAIGAVKAAWTPWISLGALGPVRLFDLGAAVAIFGLAIAFVASGIRNGRLLYAAEPLPERAPESGNA
jgi:archaetidylinositol phosphate synthase